MTQRKIERISGWFAVGCWFVYLALAAIWMGSLSGESPRQPAAASSTPAVTHKLGKHAKHATAAEQPAPQVPVQEDTGTSVVLLLDALVFLLALAASAAWNWRRKQRVRAEIRAEAWERDNLESRRRNRRAAGV